MSKPIIQIKNLNMSYRKNQVIKDLSIDFQAGETVLIAGSNGAGKSTLLKCLSHVLLPDSGSIDFAMDINRYKVAAILEKTRLYEDLTLQQSIDLHCRIFHINRMNLDVLQPLKLNFQQPVKTLSSGEKTLFHLSLLVSQDPQILMIDEILHHLDVFIRELFLDTIIDLIDRLNTTVIMVNHTFTETDRLPDRILVMEHGHFIVDEPLSALRQKVRRIKTDQEITDPLPVIYSKNNGLHFESTVYPYKEEFATLFDYPFEKLNLSEIIKSFIGGYYVHQRN
jgi:ABC-2 type transport system ATP-binding protein